MSGKKTKQRALIIVQARTGSKRLPGKVVREVLGKPLLAYLIERLQHVTVPSEIVIATTDKKRDDCIVNICRDLSISCFRGDENDVLSRYFEAAQQFSTDIIVRITADCPLMDPAVIDRAVREFFEQEGRYDYYTNCLERTFPRGMDVEVFSFNVLKKAYLETSEEYDREHVTPYLYKKPLKFSVGNFCYAFGDFSDVSLTVDTVEDFEKIATIIEDLYPKKQPFTLQDILKYLEGK